MEAADVAMSCGTRDQWTRQLEKLIDSGADELEAIGSRCRGYANHAYSRARFLRPFDEALASIGFGVDE
jgi:hypothetical protein